MIKVSICCITYNHAKYIRQCLDGFLMQKTNFPFEILIHDDASTDGTEEIIREYAERYPDIIKPIYEKENQYSKGVSISKTFNFPRVKGEYVALCEGDDYWTDENKLQKQVDFLDSNPDYTICFHKVLREFETGAKENDTFPLASMTDAGFSFENLLKYNFIQTNSVMYRWKYYEQGLEDIWRKNLLPGDWFCHLYFAQFGKIYFIPETMAVYRVNQGGIWVDSFANEEFLYIKYGLLIINFYDTVYKYITRKSYKYYNKYFSKQLSKCWNIMLKHKAYLKLLILFFNYPKDSLINLLRAIKILAISIF